MKKWLVSLLASAAALMPAPAAACTATAAADSSVVAPDTLLPHACQTDLPRYERNKQWVNYHSDGGQAGRNELTQNDFFPAMNLKYTVNRNNSLRLSVETTLKLISDLFGSSRHCKTGLPPSPAAILDFNLSIMRMCTARFARP